MEHDRLIAGAVRRTGQADRTQWSSGSLQFDHPLGDQRIVDMFARSGTAATQ
jgi:hypothetical protein